MQKRLGSQMPLVERDENDKQHDHWLSGEKVYEMILPEADVGGGNMRLRYVDCYWVATNSVIARAYEMVLPDSGEVVGRVCLHYDENEYLLRYMGHVGFHTNESFRRRGYATAALNGVIQEARRMGIKRLVVTCRPDNIVSERIIRKAGFKYEATVDVPENSLMWRDGFKQLKRFSKSLPGLTWKPLQPLPDTGQQPTIFPSLPDEHYDGFEREHLLYRIVSDARHKCANIPPRTIERIIEQVCPEFLKGLFKRRPCVRRLKFIGKYLNNRNPKPPPGTKEGHWIVGNIYESTTFNGGTYTIRGYDEGAIGCAYFVRVGPEIDSKKGADKLT